MSEKNEEYSEDFLKFCKQADSLLRSMHESANAGKITGDEIVELCSIMMGKVMAAIYEPEGWEGVILDVVEAAQMELAMEKEIVGNLGLSQ